MTDDQLTHMFTTYWGYLMFLNKKQTDSKDQPGMDNLFASLMATANQPSKVKTSPKKPEKKEFQQLALLYRAVTEVLANRLGDRVLVIDQDVFELLKVLEPLLTRRD